MEDNGLIFCFNVNSLIKLKTKNNKKSVFFY